MLHMAMTMEYLTILILYIRVDEILVTNKLIVKMCSRYSNAILHVQVAV